jgi:hypothetical protein
VRPPTREESAVAWELRTAWAKLREVVVIMVPPRAETVGAKGAPADRDRVRGYVTSVSPTDAFALMWDGKDTAHVPLGLVVAVRRPHYQEPLDGKPVPPPPPREAQILAPEQMQLF